MHRFFVEKNDIEDDIARIKGSDVHHISRVLRLENDEVISLSDGTGLDYIGKIVDISDDEVTVEISDKYSSKGEADIKIRIYQGVPKSDKMDLIVQKATELGVADIIPVQTNRAVSKIEKGKKEAKKLERWQKIAESAAKQSKRGIIPTVNRVLSLRQAIEEIKESELAIVFYEEEEEISFKEILNQYDGKDISVFIGPEGGFDPSEIEELKNSGVKSVSLGHRILRTETVALVASTIIMYELGDLGKI